MRKLVLACVFLGLVLGQKAFAGSELLIGGGFSVGQENVIAFKPQIEVFPATNFPVYLIGSLGLLPPAPIFSLSAGLGVVYGFFELESTFSGYYAVAVNDQSQTDFGYYAWIVSIKPGLRIPVAWAEDATGRHGSVFLDVKGGYSGDVSQALGVNSRPLWKGTALEHTTFEVGVLIRLGEIPWGDAAASR